jgi:protein SCO1/2
MMKTNYRILPQLLLILFTMNCVANSAFAENRTYQRTLEKYSLPVVTLINQDGKKVQLKSLMDSELPVIVDFIFGTCTTICPILSAGYVNLQQKMGADSNKVHLISISIDPENDTPKVMKEYLKRYRAKPGWDFLTGSRKDIDAVMRAFNAYIPNKMSHYALTFIRSPKDDKWVRLYGIMSSSEFMAEALKAGIQ